MYKTCLISLVLFSSLIGIRAFSQKQGQARIDSLLEVLKKAKDDSNKVDLLNDISYTYSYINGPEGINYGKQGSALAEKLNWKKGMAYADLRIGMNYNSGGDYPSALEYELKAFKIFEELNDKLGIGKVCSNIGNCYNNLKEYPKALEYYSKGLTIAEELGNKTGIAIFLMNIGTLYDNRLERPKALEYYLRALTINEELENTDAIADNLISIGNHYNEQHEYVKALEYLFKAKKINAEFGYNNGIALVFNGIGTVYLSIAKDSNRVQLNKLFAGSNYASLANGNYRDKTLQLAKKYTDSGIVINNSIGELNNLLSGYEQLSEIQALLGDHKNALESYKKYAQLNDSVFNLEKDKKLTRNFMQYDFDKKEAATRATQEKKDIQQRNMRIAMLAGSALLLLLLLVRQRVKIRSVTEKYNGEILKTQLEIKEQTLKNVSEEIHDNIGQVLSLVVLNLSALELADPVNAAAKIESSTRLVEKAVADLRNLSKTMDADNIARLGLVGVIKFDLELLEKTGVFHTSIKLSGQEKGLDRQQKLVVYRIFQQSLNNIIKHAKASSIAVHLDFSGAGLNIKIEDNGIGFEMNGMKDKNMANGAGIKNMKNRAQLIGASFIINSRAGAGTIISMNIPYNTKELTN